MPITALPTPPSRQDPTNFNDRADAFLGALPQFQSEANALEVNVNNSESTVVASASAVLAATNIVKWVSGTTYAEGAVVWSPINGLGYRRITASGSGTTDPSLDTTNYKQVNGTGDVSTSGDQTIAGTKTFTSTISGTITNATNAVNATNATTVTNGVYVTGDQTIGGTKTFTNGVRFNNGTTQTTAATTYAPSYGGVGSVVIAISTSYISTNYTQYYGGVTAAGSTLRTTLGGALFGNPVGSGGYNPSLSGTWVACNAFNTAPLDDSLTVPAAYPTLWMRIS